MKDDVNSAVATEALNSGYENAEKMLNDNNEIERLLQRLEKKMEAVPIVGNN